MPNIFKWKTRRMWGIYVEYLISLFWAHAMMLLVVLWAIGNFITLPEPWRVEELLPQWTGLAIGVTCLLQFAVGMFLDRRYERPEGRSFYWMIWYPTAFWFINLFTSVAALPALLVRYLKKDIRARWVSPDRGIPPA